MSNISIYSEVIQEKRPLLKTILQQYGNFNIWEATNLLLEKGKRNITLYNPDFIKLVKLTFPHLDKEYLEKLERIRSGKFIRVKSFAERYEL